MTIFASAAVFRRDGKLTFRARRKEASHELTQARKSAARHWTSEIAEPDKLATIYVVYAVGSFVYVSEKTPGKRAWMIHQMTFEMVQDSPHIMACLDELGIDPTAAPPSIPDVLEINGIIYRREI